MCAHSEDLNAPLLPRSCAKCCFGCIPAIDRSLAAGGEMAAGRDCARFNEFIQAPSCPNGLWIQRFLLVNKASLRSVLGPRGQPPLFVALLSTALDSLLPALPALSLLWLQVFALECLDLTLFLNAPLVVFPYSVFNYLAPMSSANYWLSPMKWRPCCFALLLIHKRASSCMGLGYESWQSYTEMRLGLFRGTHCSEG